MSPRRRPKRYTKPQIAALWRLYVSGPDYASRFHERTVESLIDEGLVDRFRYRGQAAVRLSGEGVYFMGGDDA